MALRVSKFLKMDYCIVLLIGIALGSFLGSMHNSRSESLSMSQSQSKIRKGDLGPTKGLVTNIEDAPVRNTVHIDEQGRPITKQQLLEPFVIPNLVGFSVATFLPGQVMMPPHEHETMHELFYVISGRGWFSIDVGAGSKNVEVVPGTFLHMAPGEKHGIWVADSSKEPLKMVVTGVAVGEKKK